MCTAISLYTKQRYHYLARTMDFAFEFNGIPTIVPRHYHYQFDLDSDMRLEYGFVGTNLKVGRYRFGDGINEKGLAISNHYFTGEASYSTHKRYGYFNLAPEEFIVWVLGFNKSISELKQKVKKINIMNEKNTTLNIVPPLHFMVTDETGHTVAIEPHNGLLIVKDNYVHTLTNVRHQLRCSHNEDENLMNCFKVLESVSIPQGAVIDANKIHYTQYQLVMESKERSYYIKPYFSNQIFKIKLTEDLLSKNELTFLPINHELKITSIQ
ncbi:MAG: linear amide C-N hydrolase [Staphylococcus epidermidis]|nr:linear amide C-N hydrolase [Staphylococcus epidermidis]